MLVVNGCGIMGVRFHPVADNRTSPVQVEETLPSGLLRVFSHISYRSVEYHAFELICPNIRFAPHWRLLGGGNMINYFNPKFMQTQTTLMNQPFQYFKACSLPISSILSWVPRLGKYHLWFQVLFFFFFFKHLNESRDRRQKGNMRLCDCAVIIMW